MKTISKNICLMPWLHLHIDTRGLVKACCNANIVYGNINEQSLEEIWHGVAIRKFRKQLMSGYTDKRCGFCFKKEEAGKSSMRTETLDKFSNHVSWIDETDEEGVSESSMPVYLDLRFNNVCNFKCRTCWHGASSSWFDESKILKNNIGNKAIIEATPDNLKLINEILDFNSDIEEVYFAGGEPLLMDEHYELLKLLIATKNTGMHLRYNTNLSFLKYKGHDVCELWNNFSTVTLSVSVDGMQSQGEYIRKGLDWELLLDNFNQVKAKCPHIKMEIAPTVGVYNVLSLAELHRFFVENGHVKVNDIYLNMLDRPNHFNVKTLPKSLKQEVKLKINEHITWLIEAKATDDLIAEFNSVVEFMNKDDWSIQLPTFNKQTALMDEIRGESFWEVFPELVDLKVN